jgi:FkbM family methyltransferase
MHGCHGIPWEVNGVEFRIDPHYRDRFGPLYDPPVAGFLRGRIRPGNICIDVGANVGAYVLQLAKWSAPNGRVIAFEPNPLARAILQRHVKWNHIEDRVLIERAAVSSIVGTLKMFVHRSDGMSRLNAPNPRIAKRAFGIEVPVITLSQFCQNRGIEPDCVMIDVEGFEIQVLLGFEATLKKISKKIEIVIEMHPNAWESANTTRELAQETFASLGFVPVALTGQNDIWSEHGHIFCQRA